MKNFIFSFAILLAPGCYGEITDTDGIGGQGGDSGIPEECLEAYERSQTGETLRDKIAYASCRVAIEAD